MINNMKHKTTELYEYFTPLKTHDASYSCCGNVTFLDFQISVLQAGFLNISDESIQVDGDL